MLTFMFGMYYIYLDNILVKNMICLLAYKQHNIAHSQFNESYSIDESLLVLLVNYVKKRLSLCM